MCGPWEQGGGDYGGGIHFTIMVVQFIHDISYPVTQMDRNYFGSIYPVWLDNLSHQCDNVFIWHCTINISFMPLVCIIQSLVIPRRDQNPRIICLKVPGPDSRTRNFIILLIWASWCQCDKVSHIWNNAALFW